MPQDARHHSPAEAVHQEAKLASAQSVKSGSFKLKPVVGAGTMYDQLAPNSRRAYARNIY
jgi:hypothetical protein